MSKIANLSVQTINFVPGCVTGVATCGAGASLTAVNPLAMPVSFFVEADVGYSSTVSGQSGSVTLTLTRARDSKVVFSKTKSWSGNTTGIIQWATLDGGVYDDDGQANDVYTLSVGLSHSTYAAVYSQNELATAVWSKV